MIQEKTPLVPFARSARELPGPGRRAFFHIWNAAALLLSSAGITVLSLMLGLGMFDIEFFFDYFRHPLIFLLNWVPVLLLQLALYGLTGRQWSAYLGTALIVLLASAGSFYKLRFRSEPLLFSDLTILGAALEVAGEFDLTPNVRILLAAAAIPLGTLILFFFAKGRPGRSLRLVFFLGSALAAALLWKTVYSDEEFYRNKAVSPEHIRANIWEEMIFVSKGSVYPFLHSIYNVIETPPENYDEAETGALLASYPEAEIPEDRRVNLLVFQLESFCDYTQFGIQGLQPGFYDLYHALEAESFTGDLIVNVTGGGTVNTERCFLTGSTKLNTYSKPADSFVRLFHSLGYTTLADHPHFGTYYSRIAVNEHLGFDSFRYVENFYHEVTDTLEDHWMSDFFLFPAVLEEYREHVAAGESVFSFTVTTQGHGGFTDRPYTGPETFWAADGCSSGTQSEVSTYLSKLADTQVRITAAIEELRDDPTPVAVLLYGDHHPHLKNTAEFYPAAGLVLNAETPEGLRNSYSTRYCLWLNEAAREKLGGDLIGEGPAVSPGFLMALVFDRLGWRGSAYMQLESEVREEISVINMNGFYLTADGELVTELSDEQAAQISKLECAQYSLKKNFVAPSGEEAA